MDVMAQVGEPMPWLFVPALIVLPPIMLSLMRRHARAGFRSRSPAETFLTLAFFAMASLVLLLAFFTTFVSPIHEFDALIAPAMSRFLLIWWGIHLGGALYLLREARKDIYGLVEILVAVIALVVTAYDMRPEAFATTTIGFIGSVYVLVRGMTNLSEGLLARRGR